MSGRHKTPARIAYDKRIGAAIERERERLGMSQTTLAKAAGMGQPNLSRALKGKQTLQPDQLAAIARKLGVAVATLVPTGEPPADSPEITEEPIRRSDPGSTLPPNVEDFLTRREAELGADVVEIFRSGFRFTELQYATESELLDLAERAKRFAERAAASRTARGAGRRGGEK